MKLSDVFGPPKKFAIFHDDPPFYNCAVKLKLDRKDPLWAGGASFTSYRDAKVKCIGEAIERYSLFSYQDAQEVGRDTFAKMCEKEERPVEPSQFSQFSVAQLQREQFSNFRVDDCSSFRWTDVYNLESKRRSLPSQLIFLGSPIDHDEPLIQRRLSTGAAAGPNVHFALCKSAYEMIERDAFMFWFLNKLTPPVVSFDDNGGDDRCRRARRLLSAYGLEMQVLDLSLELPVYVFMVVLRDDKPTGLPFAVGLSAAPNPNDALMSAIEEALQGRPSRRLRLLDPTYEKDEISGYQLKDYWQKEVNREPIQFLFGGCESRSFSSLEDAQVRGFSNDEEEWLFLRAEFMKFQIDVYWRDITAPGFSGRGIVVTKVVSPQMIAMHVHPRFPYLGAKRLRDQAERLGLEPQRVDDGQDLPNFFGCGS